MIPEFTLTNATIDEAVQALHDAGVRCAKRPYGFGLKTFYSVRVAHTGDPFLDWKQVQAKLHPITLRRTNVSQLALIQEVCSQAGMTFHIPVHGFVQIMPKESGQQLVVGDGKPAPQR